MQIMNQWDNSDFRHTLGSFATGIAVATCRRADGAPLGVTINSFTSLSLTPPLVLFCLGEQTKFYADFLAAPQFAISILAAGQEHLSRHFAGPNAGDWSGIITHADEQADQPPLLVGSMGWLMCRRHAVHPGGDHAIIVGEVVALGNVPAAAPLLYFRGQYRHL